MGKFARSLLVTGLLWALVTGARADGEPTLAADEVASLQTLLDIAKAAISPDATAEAIADDLAALGLEPIIARQDNELGPFATVRTQRPLVGTRYLHVQFDGSDGAQHVSFELRPAPDAQSVASERISATFAPISLLQEGDGDTPKRWDIGGCREVWIMPLREEDLTDHPFNAYLPTDAGTLRIGVEIDPHCG